MDIDALRECCRKNKILWSTHAASRIQQRGILRIDVINCIMNGEIIEDYPTDYPHPSCLKFGYNMMKKEVFIAINGKLYCKKKVDWKCIAALITVRYCTKFKVNYGDEPFKYDITPFVEKSLCTIV